MGVIRCIKSQVTVNVKLQIIFKDDWSDRAKLNEPLRRKPRRERQTKEKGPRVGVGVEVEDEGWRRICIGPPKRPACFNTTPYSEDTSLSGSFNFMFNNTFKKKKKKKEVICDVHSSSDVHLRFDGSFFSVTGPLR